MMKVKLPTLICEVCKQIRCRSHSDGDCYWEKCPQLADNEPETSGRHCPYDCHSECYDE